MKNTILICTNNIIPKKLFKLVFSNCLLQAIDNGDTNVVLVSHYPVFSEHVVSTIDNDGSFLRCHEKYKEITCTKPFLDNCIDSGGEKNAFKEVNITNVVVGEQEYSINTIFKQLQVGLKYCNENIVIFEHDVLYPFGYTGKMINKLNLGCDICVWKNCLYWCYQGFFKSNEGMWFSRFSFKKNILEEHVLRSIETGTDQIEPCLKNIGKTDGFYVYDNYTLIDGIEVLDIKHGLNTSGYMLFDEHEKEHFYWGKMDKYLDYIDDNYKIFINKHSDCFYGFGE